MRSYSKVFAVILSIFGISFFASNTYAETYVHEPLNLKGRSYSNLANYHHPYLFTGSEPNGSFSYSGDYYDYAIPNNGSYKIMNGSDMPNDQFSGVFDYYTVDVHLDKSVFGKVLVMKTKFDFRYDSAYGEPVSKKVLKRSYNPLVQSNIAGKSNGLKRDKLSCFKDSSFANGCFGDYYHNFMLHNSFYNSGAVPLDQDELLLDFRGVDASAFKNSSQSDFTIPIDIFVSQGIVKHSDNEYFQSKALWYYSYNRDIYVGSDSFIEISDFTGSEDDLNDSIEAHNANVAKAIDDITNGWHSGPTGTSNPNIAGYIGSNNLFAQYSKFWNFELKNPFAFIFEAFSSNQCVNLPTFASMLNLNDSTYCSWWNANLRSIITPVFSFSSLMLVFGFVVRWFLNGRVGAFERKGDYR